MCFSHFSLMSIIHKKMKSKDLQKIVLSKHESGDGPMKIFRDLGGQLSITAIKRWIKMIRKDGAIHLATPPGRPRSTRTKAVVKKVKSRLKGKKAISIRKLASELDINRESVRRILREDLRLRPYKKTIQPFMTDTHKEKRRAFCKWVLKNFNHRHSMRILFSDEKIFDLDGMYNSQNDRVWATDRGEADLRGGIKKKSKFPQKVMVWLAVCSEGVSPLVILDKGTVDNARYISEVLPVARKFGNKVFGDDWCYQQDGATCHTHQRSQDWCRAKLPAFIEKGVWPPNSPDLNPLDYSIWDEFVHVIEWSNVTSKQALIEELKRAVKRIRPSVVFESCSSWRRRVQTVLKNNGDYLRK